MFEHRYKYIQCQLSTIYIYKVLYTIHSIHRLCPFYKSSNAYTDNSYEYAQSAVFLCAYMRNRENTLLLIICIYIYII